MSFPLTAQGRKRMTLDSFIVRAYDNQGDYRGTNFPEPWPPAEERAAKPNRSSKGKDVLGRYRLSEFETVNGPVKGRLTLRHYVENNLAVVSAEASNADPSIWWKGWHFGLQGEGTVGVKLSLPGYREGLAIYMNEEWWSHPSFPKRPEAIQAQVRFLAWREKDGAYACLLPLSGGDFVSSVSGVPGGVEVRASCFDDARARAAGPVFVAAFGADPYETADRASRAAMKLLGTAAPRTDKKFPEPLEYLGWCTWDAFYRDVDAKGVEKQLESFKRKGIPVRFLLLDDGWYTVTDNHMVDCFADPKKFPGGLAPMIRKARKKYGIKYVGAWHALTGHWMGIHRDNRLPKAMKSLLLRHKGWPPAPPTEEAAASRFYGIWHQYLKRQGVDLVKVDGQSHLLRYCRNRIPLARGAASIQRALQTSVAKCFKGNMINCMSLGQDQSWNWHRSNVTRSSDDFMLNGVESDPSNHARINAYNAYWLSPIAWPDWDMFWSASPNRVLHQALRAVSGGPVYVSDKVGASDADILRPLCLTDGRLLRCDEPGRPTEDCLFTDPRTLTSLKIMNRSGLAGILCLVQAGKKPADVTASFKPSDIRGLEGDEFAVWGWHLKEGRRLKRAEAWKFALPKRSVSLFVAQPIRDGFAPIGLTDKLIAPKTIESWKVGKKEATVNLKEGGAFTAYCKRLPLAVWSNGRNLPYEYREGWLQVPVPPGGSPKLTIRF